MTSVYILFNAIMSQKHQTCAQPFYEHRTVAVKAQIRFVCDDKYANIGITNVV